MNERTTNGTPPATEEKRGTGKQASDQRLPTSQDRWELIQRLQTRAIQRTDPLAANLEVLSGDLMGFAYRLRETMDERLEQAHPSPKEYERFYRDAEMYSKLVREIVRLAHLERHLSPAAET